MQSRSTPPMAAFVACCLIWGSTFLAIRLGNDALPPMWAASLRLWLASLVLGAILIARRLAMPSAAEVRVALVYGLLAFGVNFALLYWGELKVPSGIAAVLYATIPLTTALFAFVVGIERPNAWKFFAALLAIAGVALIFSGELSADVPLLALLAVLSSATAASFSGVLLKRGPAPSPIATNAIGCAAGAAFTLVASFVAGEAHTFPRTAAAWLPLLYLTVAGSLVAFVLYAWLLKRWEASRASFIAVMIPIIALLLGTLLGDERISLTSLAGTVIVLASVVLALRKGRGAPQRSSGRAQTVRGASEPAEVAATER